MRIQTTRVIAAPIETVFHCVADVREFSKALPHVIDIEFLTDSHEGLGTRFRETREMQGKPVTTELQVAEYEPCQRVRIVTTGDGTVWDTVFSLRALGNEVEMEMVMDARSKKLLPRIMNRLIKPMVQKAVERDMDLVKAHCEQS